MDFGDFAELGGRDPKDFVLALINMAEGMSQRHISEAMRESTADGRKTALSKVTLAHCLALAVMGHAYYSAKVSPEEFGRLVGKLVEDAMGELIRIKAAASNDKEDTDDTATDDTEGSAWSRRRAG